MTTGKEMSEKDNGRSAQKERTSLDLNANVTASSSNMNASASESVWDLAVIVTIPKWKKLSNRLFWLNAT